MQVALGLKARTGRATLIALGGASGEPVFIERTELRLLPGGDRAPYHAAEGLEPSDARESVRRSIEAAHRLAEAGIHDAAQRLSEVGHTVSGCAVMVGTGMPAWSTAEILAVHIRMHKAEGELFRDALVAGVHACGLPLITLPEKLALQDAARILGMTAGELATQLRTIGKVAGPPWGKDQKEAAAAALVALPKTNNTKSF